MKTIMLPIVWAFTLMLALPSHQPSFAPVNICHERTSCSRPSHRLTAPQMRALDAVAAEIDNAASNSRHTGGAAPAVVLD